MTTRIGRPWPKGGMPPMVKPVSSRASFAFARRTSGSPVTAARRARSTRLGPETRHRIGSSAPASAGATKTSDLTICPSSASTAPAASSGGVRRLGEHAGRRGSRPCGRRRRRRAGSGPDTGARARRRVYMRLPSSAPARPGRIAIVIAERPAGARATAARHVVVVAAGDVPARAALDAAWPGWDGGVDAVVAADGGLPRADALGLDARRCVVGDLDSADAGARRGGRGARASGSCARPSDKDESDTELARRSRPSASARRGSRSWARSAARASTTRSPTCGSSRHAALAGSPAVLLDERVARVAARRRPAPGRRRRPAPPAGPVGATVSLLPFGGDVEGVTTRALRYPLRGRAARRRARRAACPTSATGAGRRGRDPRAAGSSSSRRASVPAEGYPRRHEHAAGRRPGPGGRASR